MKKVFILCAGLLVVGAAMANVPPKVSAGINAKFLKEFKNASNVSWIRTGDYTEAIFDWNGIKSQAFFSQEGNLVAFAQNVSVENLPQKALGILKTKYSKYKITEVSKIEHADIGTKYYIALENESKKIILETDINGSISLFQKSNK